MLEYTAGEPLSFSLDGINIPNFIQGEKGESSWKKRRKYHLSVDQTCLPNISPHTKFHPNRMKNIEVKEIRYWSALVGRFGQSKNSLSHFKLILCCF